MKEKSWNISSRCLVQLKRAKNSFKEAERLFVSNLGESHIGKKNGSQTFQASKGSFLTEHIKEEKIVLLKQSMKCRTVTKYP